MNQLIILVFVLVSATNSLSQNSYAVYFIPKNFNNAKLALSQDAIDRKKKFQIPIDPYDYAIETTRLEGLATLAPISKVSNWLNSCLVVATDAQIQKIKQLPFVSSVQLLKTNSNKKSTNTKLETNYTIQEYGEAYRQINMHHGDILHGDNYQGEGIKIAVFDAGFPHVDSMKVFKHLFEEKRIFPVRNIVYNSSNLFSADGHGTAVMGCMASYIKDTIVAAAPKASYYLFITEDARSESKIEEFNWAIAAQMADSIGIDMINSSLGYSEFEDAMTNYKTSDMDGNTALSSKAATIASSKGIIVVNAAGNLGNNPWRIVSAPADAGDVISVGSVNKDALVSPFSSRGFNTRNIVKPTIAALGESATLYYKDGNFIKGNGTSFASPIMAGLIACYWQKHSTWSPDQIKKSIVETADNYWTPNKDVGYGIVDFKKAWTPFPSIQDTLKISVYPNPSNNAAIIEFNSNSEINSSEIELFHFDKRISVDKLFIKNGYNQIHIDLNGKSSGLYFVKIKMDNYSLSGKFEKE